MKINYLNTASDKPNTCINLNLCVYKSNLYHCIFGPYTNLKSHNSGGSGGMATPAPLIRTPRPYSVGDDFALWIRRFEAYTRAVRIPDDKLSDALLALLDDAAFRAFDLLGLPEETVKDYKQLVDALKKRFAPGAGQQELRFLLGQRVQEAGETLDGFADALIHLANRAYPEMESKLRMELARDRFVAGVQEEYIQEALLRSPPETLDRARETAKCAEAAQAARRRMRPKKTRVCATSSESEDTATAESKNLVPSEVAAVGNPREELAEAVRRNTEMLERLLSQMQMPGTSSKDSGRAGRRRPPTCWRCGQLGHLRRDCPGNEKRPSTWVDRRPRTQ